MIGSHSFSDSEVPWSFSDDAQLFLKKQKQNPYTLMCFQDNDM